ncbi:hypothetical protein [Geminocystis sp. NIES-3709]|nr:hypothetical protein [Geminocystis sp. NIES-3709]
MPTHVYDFQRKPIRFVDNLPIAEDIGGALGFPVSAISSAIDLLQN